MEAIPHPNPKQLSAYLVGKLSWSEMEQVDSHLGNCADCQSRMSALEPGADSFVSYLRGAGGPAADDPSLASLLARARAFTQTTIPRGEPETLPIVAGHNMRHEIARGGLGVVYLAYHPILKDYRAIKRPLSDVDLEPRILLARFQREVEAVGAVRHEHVIRAHDAGTDGDGPYLVMEYLDGKPLSQLVSLGPLPVAETCGLIRQAALGLQAAHESGLVHRDVKPSNLMLARCGSGTAAAARVVVIDWGLVKRTGEESLTVVRTAMGTLDYMAPEQVRDASTVDIRADIYSLGATMYCLLAGKPPFAGRTLPEKLVAQEKETFPPLERLRSDVPKEVLAVLNKMVEKNFARRYATPREVAHALEPFGCAGARLLALLDGTPIPVPPGPIKPLMPPWLWAAAGCLVVGLLTMVLIVGVPLSLILRHQATPNTTDTDKEKKDVHGDAPTTPVSMSGHTGHCSSLVFTPDGHSAVSESGGGSVCIWDLRNHRLEKSWTHMFGAKEPSMSGVVAVSPDGRVIAAAGLNADLLNRRWLLFLSLYDRTTYARIVDGDYTFARMSPAIAFSPDSSKVATEELPGFIGGNRSIHVIDIQTRMENVFPIGVDVNSLAFSPDGDFLLMGSDDHSVRLWHLKPNRAEREFRGHTAAVDTVAFSTDGQRIFTASSGDGTVRVWNNDKSAGAVVEKVEWKIEAAKNRAAMTCAAFWPAGRALTGHGDGSVVLWDLTTSKEVRRFEHPGTKVTAVAISPDGNQALAAHSDHLVYLYQLPPPRRAGP